MSARVFAMISLSVLILACASCGPRMNYTPAITPYERPMPPAPAGTVPATGRLSTLTLDQSRLASSPLPRNEQNLLEGKKYYAHYCGFCHGPKGDGQAVLGFMYSPTPTKLTSATLSGMTDGELYYRMLHGPGHDPVMSETVVPPYRWPIVTYVRSLQKPSPNATSGGQVAPILYADRWIDDTRPVRTEWPCDSAPTITGGRGLVCQAAESSCGTRQGEYCRYAVAAE